MEIQFKNGDLLIGKTEKLRILLVKDDLVVLCNCNTHQCDIFSTSSKHIWNKVVNQELEIKEDSYQVTDYTDLTKNIFTKFKVYKQIIQEISDRFGPSYLDLKSPEFKQEIIDIYTKYNISKTTFWKLIRLYLQGGCHFNAILDARKSNGKTPRKLIKKSGKKNSEGIFIDSAIKNHFDEALRKYKSGRANTLRNCYLDMCNKHFSIVSSIDGTCMITLLPASERPTLRQFQYYVRKHLTKEQLDIIKTSKQEVRNANRILLSDTLFEAKKPGDLIEMDEEEVDISLISTINSNWVIGRPIVYLMFDVYSRMIVAISVTLENNSFAGATSCMLNLVDDKVNYCLRHGLEINSAQWPCSPFVPSRIRTDRGSEYISNELKRACNEIGIDIQNVSAASGSLKGNVEHIFHTANISFKSYIEKVGLISKRHDSNHHKKASLTIDDFTQMILAFAVSYNQSYLKNYPLTKDMLEKGINPTPIEIWNYGCTYVDAPLPVFNKNQFIYSLLKCESATVSRDGINYKGLFYINMDDSALLQQMYEAKSRKVKIKIRVDPRDLRTIYRLVDNQLYSYSLNKLKSVNSSFLQTELNEVDLDFHNCMKRERDKNGRIRNDEIAASRNLIYKNITDYIQPREKNDVKNLKEKRKIEKVITNQNDALIHHFDEAEIKQIPKTASPVKKKKVYASLDEAIDNFWEDE